MRYNRLIFILLAFYLVFVGGGTYYQFIPLIRYFHHALLTVLFSAWLIARARHGHGLPSTPLNIPIFALVIIWIISAALGLDPRVSFEQLWFMLVHVLLFFVLVDMVQKGKKRMVMEAQFILAALVVMLSALELFSWYFGLGITPTTRVGWFGAGVLIPFEPIRLSLAMGISTWLAAYTAPLVVVTAGWAMTTPQRSFRKVLWILSGALLITLLLTFSRGGILACVASIITLVIIRAVALGRSGFSRGVMLALVGMVVLSLISVLLISRVPGRVSGDTNRLELWRSAVRMVSAAPAFGVGPGMFGRGLRLYSDHAYATDHLAAAHNLYLNIAAEMGVVGVGIALVLGIILLRTWWQTWNATASPMARLRQGTVYAALTGGAIQCLFDNFAVTSVVSVYLVLLAYSVGIAPAAVQQTSRTRWTSITALGLVVAYGIWLIPVDSAHFNWQNSLRNDTEGVASLQMAASLDPGLRLYPLSTAYRTEASIAAYEDALRLEPTWDIGWMNMAALAERQGDLARAIDYLDQARQISQFSPASLHWARLSEQAGTADREDIIDAYLLTLQNTRYNIHPPLSAFWSQTPFRRQALERYSQTQPLDRQYRIAAVHNPEELAALVPVEPVSAAEWWVWGEHHLTVKHDPETTISSFSQAIALDPANGDYYASRARAAWETDPQGAERDLKLAELLMPVYEYPNAIRAHMASNPEAIYSWRASSLPPQVTNQHFAPVLYARQAAFDLLPEMRYPGPGTHAMQPWYDVAKTYEAHGQAERAINAYRAILNYAPDETAAREQLDRLEAIQS